MNHETHRTPDNPTLAESDTEKMTLNSAYEELLAERIGELDDEEREALQVYCDRLPSPPTPGTEAELVDRFTADYWGTFASVQDFVDNWAFDMEPMESVQSLLHEQGRPDTSLNIAEMALMAHLSGDIEFVFTGGRVIIFTKEGK